MLNQDAYNKCKNTPSCAAIVNANEADIINAHYKSIYAKVNGRRMKSYTIDMANEDALKIQTTASMPRDSLEYFKLIDKYYQSLETARIKDLQTQLDKDIKQLNLTIYKRLGKPMTFDEQLRATINTMILKHEKETQAK